MSTMYPYHTGAVRTKTHWIAVLLSVLLGTLGVDRLYLGHYWLFGFKLLAFSLSFGTITTIWWILDIVLIATKKVDDRKFVWR